MARQDPLRSDDRRKVANAESRTAAFSGGFFAQREAQESAREDSRMSAGRARNVDQQWGRPR